MKKICFLLLILSFFTCQPKKQADPAPITVDSLSVDTIEKIHISENEEEVPQPEPSKEILKLVPKGHTLFQEIYGDLNKDGLQDCILIIKDTDKENIIDDEYRGRLDRNRRGIIIAFNKGDHYQPVVSNYFCFASENEDGGVYFAPELYITVNSKGNLDIQYLHGRYGRWGYIFRYQNNAFEMIGSFIESNRGPVGLSKESINFSTKKRQISVNTCEDCESGDEKWKDTWEDIQDLPLINLNEIDDFDTLSLERYYKKSDQSIEEDL